MIIVLTSVHVLLTITLLPVRTAGRRFGNYGIADVNTENTSILHEKLRRGMENEDNANDSDVEVALKYNLTNTNILATERKNNKMHTKFENDDEELDCRKERAKIVEDRKSTEDLYEIYIPSCTGPNDSLYNATQCHPLIGICWCAEPSGAVIAGSSKSKDEIRCDPESIRKLTSSDLQPIAINQPEKPLTQKIPNRNKNRGCQMKKMKKFLRLHMNSLKIECYAAGQCLHTKNEKTHLYEAALRQFNLLDHNRNKELDKTEWKSYRDMLIHEQSFSRTRKCAKLFMRFCDVNNNRRISREEWINCTVKSSSIVYHRLMRFTNPFLDVLRPES